MNTHIKTHRMIRYHVKPRYTSGSPAVVDSTTASRLIQQERDSYERMIAGVYGEDKKAQAIKLGLGGIVEDRWTFRDKYMFRDAITGDTGLVEPFCLQCGKRHPIKTEPCR